MSYYSRTDYIIGFIFGVLCLALGVYFILLQFFSNGIVVDLHAPDPYSIFEGWAVFGVISLFVGAFLIYKTYQIFLPLKDEYFTPSMICPRCGAVVDGDAVVCEKCKEPIGTG